MAFPDKLFGIRSEVLEHIDDIGFTSLIERFERLAPVGYLQYSKTNKMSCEACDKHGKNLACPPYSPDFPEHIGVSGEARVICYRVHMENVQEVSGEPRYRSAFRLVRGLLSEELYKYRKEGYVIAGAGACLFCKECVVETGEKECRAPSRLIYSLESLGVNLISLSEQVLGLKLQWGGGESDAEHVAAIGAAFE
jgi:predicted metal-binding protein